MAHRYSGSLKISVVYDDRNFYRTAVSEGGKLLWRGRVSPAPSGFGPGVAYDSSQAYDEVASTALSFADHEKRGIGDSAEFDEGLTGYLIRRSPHRASSPRSGAREPGVGQGSQSDLTSRDIERDVARLSSAGERRGGR